MIYFFLGLIVGMLVRDIKTKIIETVLVIKNTVQAKEEPSQFYEPVTEKEKWEKAKNIDELLDN